MTRENELPKLNILLSEDNIHNAILIKVILKKTPFSLTMAKNGEEALTIAKTKNLDIILMDLDMPIMDGLTATRKIREFEKKGQKPPVPIIALTAHDKEEYIHQSLAAGCNGYLNKPLKKTTLIKAILDYTHNSQLN